MSALDRHPTSPHRPARLVVAVTALAISGLLASPAHAAYFLVEIANTGSGAFNGGQLFGTPILQSSTGEVFFAGQDTSRLSGIFTGTAFGTMLLNADPIGG